MAQRLLGRRYTVALAGNPNVGKSTVFNCLTGLHQRTGNWAGKTVENTRGRFGFESDEYTLIDLPGTYSLFSRSREEEHAESFIALGEYDAVAIIADANCLERNLSLVMQILQVTDNVILGVNLMDEAEKNGVRVDTAALSRLLRVPVVPMSAGRNRGMDVFVRELAKICKNPLPFREKNLYTDDINGELSSLRARLDSYIGNGERNGYYAARLLCDIEYGEKSGLFASLDKALRAQLYSEIKTAQSAVYGICGSKEGFGDILTGRTAAEAERLASQCVTHSESAYKKRLARLDKIFTGKYTGLATMLCLLLGVLWLTIYGANYPSEWLSSVLLGFEDTLASFFIKIGMSDFLVDMLAHGAYRVLAWVTAVMLPPMAIFFPLFTLLEDFGYLPRVAFNLDYYFKKAGACGKQALTMCMGFGCNAVGVTGCRIIDSPRERLIAMLTNCLVPCNGRFPTLIAIITMFFLTGSGGALESVLSASILCGVIVLGILMTLAVSRLLSRTLLRGVPSAFTLELPPFRRPQIGKTIVRSVFDRTLFVLGRAASVAAPTGIIIWIAANITVGGDTMLNHITELLEPLGRLLGMDGVILTAFILGFPANEIVLPIILMAYMSSGELCEYSSLSELRELLVGNGWTVMTAVSVMLFSLMHWPCSTTLLTIKKESGSLKWTLLSFVIPTLCGAALCFAVNCLYRLAGLII